MITAVDTNILLDVFVGDKDFGPRSAEALRRCIREGALVACEAVWAETATAFPGDRVFLDAMEYLGIRYDPIAASSALKAAAYWRKYRKQGGNRGRIVADFLIGAHAEMQADRLLTRDRGFFRSAFRKLSIVNP